MLRDHGHEGIPYRLCPKLPLAPLVKDLIRSIHDDNELHVVNRSNLGFVTLWIMDSVAMSAMVSAALAYHRSPPMMAILYHLFQNQTSFMMPLW